MKYNFSDREKEIIETLELSEFVGKVSDSKLKSMVLQNYTKYKEKYSSANTLPNIQTNNKSAIVEHEATTGKISEEVNFYAMSRGLNEDNVAKLVTSGYCKEVLKNLPFEFAVEAKKLLEISMDGSIG